MPVGSSLFFFPGGRFEGGAWHRLRLESYIKMSTLTKDEARDQVITVFMAVARPPPQPPPFVFVVVVSTDELRI